MRRAVVTGCAGFIGSHLTERLIEDGFNVTGVDDLSDYYGRDVKVLNMRDFSESPRFEFVHDNVKDCIADVLRPGDLVFHQAGQPGVRSSWRDQFADYVDRNTLSTQRLLEAALTVGASRVVYASSSSVYGNADRYPVSEDTLTRPHSPYGVTKLAAEQLCVLYARNFGLPTVSLRYFTVFGPRQRPDMALHRLIDSALTGASFELYGDGTQIRDFTYVGDVVSANIRAAQAAIEPGIVVNVAGGAECSMLDLISMVEDEVGSAVNIVVKDVATGDVHRTGASTERAEGLLGWRPRTTLREGIAAQVSERRERLLGLPDS